jgi:uncharacterized membrane protein (UPF0127 family)
MKSFHVVKNERSGRILGRYVRRANSVISRMVGLIAERSVPRDSGLWITPCNGVHTLCMKAAIDIYYLDRHGNVLAIDENAQPNRYVRIVPRAQHVLQLGRSREPRDVVVGDTLTLLIRNY